MNYIIIIISIISVLFLFIKVQLKIEKKEEVLIYLMIGKFYKKKLNKKTGKSNTLKDLLEIVRKINNPIIEKILKKVTIENITITAGFKIDDSPYIIFSGHLILLQLQKIITSSFKKIKKQRYQIVVNNKQLKGEVLLSINLIKLVIIILCNYHEYQMIVRKEIS